MHNTGFTAPAHSAKRLRTQRGFRVSPAALDPTDTARRRRSAAQSGGAVEEKRDDHSEERTSAEVVLAIQATAHRVGFAALDMERDEIELGCAVISAQDAEHTLESLCLQYAPWRVLVSSKLGSALVARLETLLRDPEAPAGDGARGGAVTVMRTADFSGEAAKAFVAQLQLERPGEAPQAAAEDAGIAMVLRSDDAHEMVEALGAVVRYNNRENVLRTMEDGGPVLRDLRFRAVQDYMHMDTVSFRTLQIFDQEMHPSVVKGFRKPKEGFSLYTLLDETVSPLGRKLLRHRMLKPTRNLEELNARYSLIEALIQPELGEVVAELKGHMRHVRDLPYAVKRLQRALAGRSEWRCIASSLRHMAALCDSVRAAVAALRDSPRPDLDGSATVLHEACSPLLCIQQQLSALHADVESVLDLDAIAGGGVDHVGVLAGVDATLDEYRDVYSTLEDYLTVYAEKQSGHEDYCMLGDCTWKFVYLPQVGFLVQVTPTSRSFAAPPAFRFQFEADGALHYKTAAALELDETFGDMQSIIVDMEDTIVRRLAEHVLLQHAGLLSACDSVAELDVGLALAQVAQGFNLSRPEVTAAGGIFIKGGRNLVQELTVDLFVPNDTILDHASSASVAIITGPNNSGKSVYLKQVGLIVYMAQVGAFVPAQRAVISVVDRILTRICSLESAAVAESTFTIDVAQMALMLRSCTSDSLLLVDEFGKGTATADGVALLASTVRYLTASVGRGGTACPKTVITTHFHELFEFGLLDDCPGAIAFQMECVLEGDKLAGSAAPPASLEAESLEQAEAAEATTFDRTTGRVVPLYKLRPGRAASSHGLDCALRSGVPEPVVHRAQQVQALMQRRAPIPAMMNAADAAARQQGATHRMLTTFAAVPDWGAASDVQLEALLQEIRAFTTTAASMAPSAAAGESAAAALSAAAIAPLAAASGAAALAWAAASSAPAPAPAQASAAAAPAAAPSGIASLPGTAAAARVGTHARLDAWAGRAGGRR